MSYSFKVTKVIKIEKVDGVKKDVARQMIDVKTVAGHDYFGLSWQNRNVSLLFGKSSGGRSVAPKVSGGWPASVIGFIKRARNLATDKLISEHIKKNDPMADFATLDHMSPKDRTNAFHDAEVPAMLNVEALAFTTDDGDHVDAQTLNILSSPNRHKKVYLQLTADHLKWLSMLFNRRANPDDVIESDDDSDDEEARVECIKPLLPPGVTIGKGPRNGATRHSWILRLAAKRKQIQVNYSVQDTDDVIKDRIKQGVDIIYMRAGIALEDA